jgi:hypothetical protein
MATVTGVVEGYGTKYDKFSLNVNGTWYATKQEWYKGPDVATLKGQTVTFDDGGGKFLKNVRVASGAATTTSAAPAVMGGVGFPIGPLDKQRSIIRQNSLAHAVNCVVGCPTAGASPKDLAEMAVAIAPIFEAYSAGDTIREEVEKGKAAAEAAVSADPFE